MPAPSTSSADSLPYIPLAYRILLLYVEPFMALNGAFLCLFSPALFLKTFSPVIRYAPSNQIVYDQLGATYILFAFNQAVVLRIATDFRVWKAVVLGILVCDIVHFYAGWKLMMDDGNTAPWGWRPEDWVAVLSLLVPGGLRVALLCEVGIKKVGKGGITGEKRG